MSESNKKICPVQKKCGGCKLLPIPYSEQLQKKQKKVSSLLSKYGRV